jgi:single-stranded-DNA-specific exonuclease
MPVAWSVLPPVQPSAALTAAVGGHPLVAQLLAQRGLDDPARARAFLDPQHYAPAPPSALTGVAAAATVLADAIRRKARILVWGDFDVDGQTSTSLLVAALRRLAGDDRVLFHVPNRFREGHGMRLDKLQAWVSDAETRPDLVITCDTGITDGEAVGYAKDQGITVIVTDHHDPPPDLLALKPVAGQLWDAPVADAGQASVRRADAIVNPKFLPRDDPLRTLPGVGVAYKLVQELYRVAGRSGDESDLLDLVALGIVADVAEQVHDARYLLQLGLERLRTTRRTGLLALMEIARVTPSAVDTEAIGFQLGPRMNALGRLEDATVAVELLTTRDPIRAGQLAARMERLNQQRRLLTSQITAVALEMIERAPALLDFNGLVIAHPAWHAGIVGIVASRLAEQFHKPTVLLLTPPGEAARGSARSVAGVDIGSAIAACGHLLLTHGGHPGAAGLSLLPENIDRFRRELDRQIDLHRTQDIAPGLTVDAVLHLESVSLPLADDLRRLAPFGNGNPTPNFMSINLTVVEDRRLGRDGGHRRLVVRNSTGAAAPVLWFKSADMDLPSGPIDLVYTIGVNEFRGERSLQLTYVESRQARDDAVTLTPAKTVEVHDCRGLEARPTLPGPDQAVWYAEGIHIGAPAHAVPYAPRVLIQRQATPRPLVLYSVPPAPDLLAWIYETVRPSAIYLVGQVTTDDALDDVLRQVAGMCKFALQRGQLLHIDRMAARLGTTEAVIRYSLLWLESRGQITMLDWQSGDQVHIERGVGHGDGDEALWIQAQLDQHLAEVRAYRRYFLRAATHQLGLPVT